MKPLHLIDKAFLLKKTHLFGSLDLDLLLTLSDKMEIGEVKKGTKIFYIGQEAHRMYLIVQGKVEIMDQDKKPLASLSGGEFFGDESIFSEKPRAYEAITATDTTLLILSRSHLLSIIAECPDVAVALLEYYTASLSFRPR